MMPDTFPPQTAAEFAVRRLVEHAPQNILPELAEAVLVPVPRSSLSKPGALWPSLEVCNALRARGIGVRVLTALRREKPVPKAAWADTRDRPDALTHCDSLAVDAPLALPGAVVLVDDVVTRGAALLGAAWRLDAARAGIDVRAFALIRTVSDAEDFVKILDPRAGSITLRAGRYVRDP